MSRQLNLWHKNVVMKRLGILYSSGSYGVVNIVFIYL